MEESSLEEVIIVSIICCWISNMEDPSHFTKEDDFILFFVINYVLTNSYCMLLEEYIEKICEDLVEEL